MIMVWGASSLIPYEALNIGLNIIGFGSARVFAHFGLRPSPWR